MPLGMDGTICAVNWAPKRIAVHKALSFRAADDEERRSLNGSKREAPARRGLTFV
jgi:hypothetical protein